MGNTNLFVLQLIPSSVGGVNDYAHALKSGGLKGTVVKLTEGDRPTFRGDETVLLHYSGYGYARRGAPLWLLGWLREERPRIRRLGVFFHELYANGPPWKSEFWLSPIQRHIARGLATTADFWLTNRQASAHWLGFEKTVQPQAVLATPSNVGELMVTEQKRDLRIVVFGGAGLRSATYSKAGRALYDWSRYAGLEIYDIGPPISDSKVLNFMADSSVNVQGRLSAESTSQILAKAQYGLVAYPLSFASKSGVIGAYCAHGVCPIILSEHKLPSDGLVPGENCLTRISPRLLPEERDRISKNAISWYRPHSVENHVKKISEFSVDQSGK